MMSRNFGDTAPSSRAATAETRALWLLLAVGLALLLAAAAASGEEKGYSSSRTDRFSASLPAGGTVRVANVNGDIVAGPGRQFSAAVTTTVTASSQARADEILQKMRIDESREGDEYRLETRWPGQAGPRGHERRHDGLFCRDCRVVSRYELVVPPGLRLNLQTVNGEVRVSGLDGDVEIHSVNGNLQATGVRRALTAQTVNGKVEAAADALPPGILWELQTVNGAVLATLPKDAKFEWRASTMSGAIASTFALPAGRDETTPAAAPPAPPAPPAPARPRGTPRAPIVVSDEDGDTVIDTEQLAREIEMSMREVETEVREARKEMERVRVVLPEHRYVARVGGGGATLRTSTLNGSITLLAAGTREGDARPLVSGRRSYAVTVPLEVRMLPDVKMVAPPVRVERLPRPESLPAPEADSDGEDVVRGDISGDFLSTSNAGYHLGNVSGKVKILTHSGEIHVASAGRGAEIKTYGGDVHIGAVRGDLLARTLAGDVRAGDVTGSATVDTSGGDIRIDRIAGSATARTEGGDIVLTSVGGSVEAETGGGEVRIAVASKLPKNGVTIRNAGGDVVLTLPSDFRGEVDLEVEGPVDPGEVLIRSEFPGVAITRSAESQRASGVLNGGGPRVLVRTSSGSIRLRRGAPAGS